MEENFGENLVKCLIWGNLRGILKNFEDIENLEKYEKEILGKNWGKFKKNWRKKKHTVKLRQGELVTLHTESVLEYTTTGSNPNCEVIYALAYTTAGWPRIDELLPNASNVQPRGVQRLPVLHEAGR